MRNDNVQTIELTCRKWKAMFLWVVGLGIVGVMALLNGAVGFAVFLFIVAAVLNVVRKIGRWWTNG